MSKKNAAVPEWVISEAQALTQGNWAEAFEQQVQSLDVREQIPFAVEAFVKLAKLLPASTFSHSDRMWDAILVLAIAVKAGSTNALDTTALAKVGTPGFAQACFAESLRNVMTVSPRALKRFNDALESGLPLSKAFLLADDARFPMRVK